MMLRISANTHRFAEIHARRYASTNTAIGAPVAELVTKFKEANVKRGAVYTHVRHFPNATVLYATVRTHYKYDNLWTLCQDGAVLATHSVLEPVADFCRSDTVDFDGHEAFFFEVHPETDSMMGACLWRTVRGQGAGGIRLRGDYDTLEDYVRDGLRLAIGMGRKNALAGLWWGGGKGVISADDPASLAPEQRESLLESYGRFITSLR